MVTCREFVDFLMEYLDGGLDLEVRATFGGHMDECPDCVNFLDTYRETIRLERELLRAPPDSPVPEEVPEDLVNAVLAARKG